MPDRRDYKQAYLACMEEIEILKVELSERHKDRVRWLRERDEARAELATARERNDQLHASLSLEKSSREMMLEQYAELEAERDALRAHHEKYLILRRALLANRISADLLHAQTEEELDAAIDREHG